MSVLNVGLNVAMDGLFSPLQDSLASAASRALKIVTGVSIAILGANSVRSSFDSELFEPDTDNSGSMIKRMKNRLTDFRDRLSTT